MISDKSKRERAAIRRQIQKPLAKTATFLELEQAMLARLKSKHPTAYFEALNDIDIASQPFDVTNGVSDAMIGLVWPFSFHCTTVVMDLRVVLTLF